MPIDYYEQTYQISSVDADAAYECRPSALLAYIQRAITEQSQVAGTTRDDMLEKYGCFWMVLRLWFRLSRPVYWSELLTVRVTVRRPEGKRLYRDCDLYIGGERVGEFTSLWVLAEKDSHKTVEFTGMPEFPTENPPSAKTVTLPRILFPDGMALHDRRRLYYSDTDLNGHMNNTRYVDLATDAAELDLRPRGVFMQEIWISYVGECYSGERLNLYRGRAGGLLYIHGSGLDGSARFDCVIQMSKV